MNFVSYTFVIFLGVLLLLNFWVPARWRFGLLLAASYLFYATWSLPFIAVILVSTTVDYWLSVIIHKSNDQATRKTAVTSGIVFNLLVLVFFKYCNFFLDGVHGLAHVFGTTLTLPAALNIILPLGISFYTFEAISYMVDVYRGKPPAKSWIDYNFYIMYFPHLISGPIVRYEELARQYQGPLQLPGEERIFRGLNLILLGYIFKVLIADQAALLADPVFNNAATAMPYATLLGVLGFTVQIYFDFMGYTHIARGVSLLFNIELPLNFNHPYLATNISNFWERWHISLSRWIRDYLYIPLGGSRGSTARTTFNLMATMLIAGAWHGAGWPFIVWGGYHGLLLGGYHTFRHLARQHPAYEPLLQNRAYHVATILLTFMFSSLGWVFFRSRDLSTIHHIFSNLLNPSAILSEMGTMLSTGHLSDLVTLPMLLLCCFTGPWIADWLLRLYKPMPFWSKAFVASFTMILCWIASSMGSQNFIYFQF